MLFCEVWPENARQAVVFLRELGYTPGPMALGDARTGASALPGCPDGYPWAIETLYAVPGEQHD